MDDKKLDDFIAHFKGLFGNKKPDAPPEAVKPSTGPVRFSFEANPYAKYMPKPEKFGAGHPYLRSVGHEKSFKLKTDHNSIIAQVSMIEDLHAAIKKAPNEAVVFHLDGRNDFANWVRDCVGDWWLGSRLEKVSSDDPAAAKESIVRALDERISKLKKF